MTIKKFNDLDLEKQFQWLQDELCGQPVGKCNQVIFQDKIIFFLYSLTGKPVCATAAELPGYFKRQVKNILGELDCINIIQDKEQAYKNRVFSAMQNVTNRNN